MSKQGSCNSTDFGESTAYQTIDAGITSVAIDRNIHL
jgi:hypothetical protein